MKHQLELKFHLFTPNCSLQLFIHKAEDIGLYQL